MQTLFFPCSRHLFIPPSLFPLFLHAFITSFLPSSLHPFLGLNPSKIHVFPFYTYYLIFGYFYLMVVREGKERREGGREGGRKGRREEGKEGGRKEWRKDQRQTDRQTDRQINAVFWSYKWELDRQAGRQRTDRQTDWLTDWLQWNASPCEN